MERGQSVALSIAVIVLAAACFIIGAIAIALPEWGYFRSRLLHETGKFGPWILCKDEKYGIKTCGPKNIVMFRPSFAVFAAGVCGAVGVAALGAYGLTSLLYVTLRTNPRSDLQPYKVYILITKLIFSLVATLTTITAVALFATQGDDLANGYVITVGFSFYMEVVVGVFATILMLLTIMEYVGGRRESGHPGQGDVVDAGPTRIGLKKKNQKSNGSSYGVGGRGSSYGTNGISMTHSSGVVPFVPSVRFKARAYPNVKPNVKQSSNGGPFSKDYDSWGGSVTSMGTSVTSPAGSTLNGSTVSTISTTVSTLPRGPLRSSLKKSRTTSDSSMGIPNPGFAGSSPTLSRTSSLKKVRIQTFTTDV